MEPEPEHSQDTPLSCLISALTRLMTHYALRPNAENAGAVVRLLRALDRHPEVRAQPMLQNTYGRMLPHWVGLAVSRQRDTTMAGIGSGSVH